MSPDSCPSPADCQAGAIGPLLNLSCALAAARVVLFIITFIWSNCFSMPSTFSMQITCIPDFLSNAQPTMTVLCKQSLSTSDHFNSFLWETKPSVTVRHRFRMGQLSVPCPWKVSIVSHQQVWWAGLQAIALPPSFPHLLPGVPVTNLMQD